MTDEKITIAIVEACPGLAEIDEDNGGCFWSAPKDPFVIFDPLNDSKAMRAAIGTLKSDGSWSEFIWWLEIVVNIGHLKDGYRYSDYDYLALIQSTERQKAEAFLRTVKKWNRGEAVKKEDE